MWEGAGFVVLDDLPELLSFLKLLAFGIFVKKVACE